MSAEAVQLKLRPMGALASGEVLRPVALRTDRGTLVGRSSDADWRVADASVSRRHASVRHQDGAWWITDLGSRHGTLVNGQRVPAHEPTPIARGDILTLGTWRCRCVAGVEEPGATTSFQAEARPAGSVTVIPARQLAGVAQRGLDVLTDLLAQLDTMHTRDVVADATVRAVQRATGCRRVVLVEPASDTELAVLASTDTATPVVSHSLVEQAAREGLVQLTTDNAPSAQGHSIIELKIRSAICAAVHVDGAPAAFLMIDTRDAEGVVPADAAAFVHAVARLVGLAFQRINAADMAERHRQLQDDLKAARRAQEWLSPAASGQLGRVAFRFESIPGRVVAGDFFDVFALDETRAAFFLGDVCGKGVGAAMLMAACQSQLRTLLRAGTDPAAAMEAVNKDLFERTEPSKFVTLIGGVIDAGARAVDLVDAGHGFCLRVARAGDAERVETDAGLPLGVMDGTTYGRTRVPLDSAALVLCSDGALEQPDPSGEQFGMDRVSASISGVGAEDAMVRTLIDRVRAHASAELADDLTVAALTVV